MDAINVNLLAHPTPNIKLMELNRWKMGQLVKMHMKRELWVPDEWRTIARCHLRMSLLFPPETVPVEVRPVNIIYEIKDWAGMLGFVQIVPHYQAAVYFKWWDDKQFNKSIYREIKQVIPLVMDELKLIRLYTDTACPKMLNWGKKFGFKIEGRQKYGFMWNGKPRTQYLLRLLREEMKDASDN